MLPRDLTASEGHARGGGVFPRHGARSGEARAGVRRPRRSRPRPRPRPRPRAARSRRRRRARQSRRRRRRCRCRGRASASRARSTSPRDGSSARHFPRPIERRSRRTGARAPPSLAAARDRPSERRRDDATRCARSGEARRGAEEDRAPPASPRAPSCATSWHILKSTKPLARQRTFYREGVGRDEKTRERLESFEWRRASFAVHYCTTDASLPSLLYIITPSLALLGLPSFPLLRSRRNTKVTRVKKNYTRALDAEAARRLSTPPSCNP